MAENAVSKKVALMLFWLYLKNLATRAREPRVSRDLASNLNPFGHFLKIEIAIFTIKVRFRPTADFINCKKLIFLRLKGG